LTRAVGWFQILLRQRKAAMRILAIIDVAPSTRLEALRSELLTELRGSWALYASGTLREAYATASPTRVVFVLEADDAAHAEQALNQLPLVARRLLTYELVELRPFANWSMLFAP
jgi:hypothetical protein